MVKCRPALTATLDNLMYTIREQTRDSPIYARIKRRVTIRFLGGYFPVQVLFRIYKL